MDFEQEVKTPNGQDIPPNCNLLLGMIFWRGEKLNLGPLTGHFRHPMLLVFLEQHR